MKKVIEVTVWLIRAGSLACAKRWSFFGLFLLAFVGSTAILGALGLLPNWPKAPALVAETVAEPSLGTADPRPVERVEFPTRIQISAIDLTATVVNPSTRVIAELDKALLSGVVRYPTSAKLGEAGNVVLFGHSSYLPVVGNRAYKAFNDIQKLAIGDTVTVSSSGTAYTYRVREVSKKSADDAAILLDVSGRVLTLVTCDSFGAKTDRFVVTADFVESHSLPS